MPTSLSAGVPVIAPLVVSKDAQGGRLVIEKVSVWLSGSATPGMKLYEEPATTVTAGVPEMLGGVSGVVAGGLAGGLDGGLTGGGDASVLEVLSAAAVAGVVESEASPPQAARVADSSAAIAQFLGQFQAALLARDGARLERARRKETIHPRINDGCRGTRKCTASLTVPVRPH
jgi:predicted lipid-binding transport protein (Tim44 family)